MLTENRYSTFINMNYILMPSLKHIALVRIAITLWNDDHARDLLSKLFHLLRLSDDGRESEWQEVQNEVIKKVMKLELPESLKNKLESFVLGAYYQIWEVYHNDHRDLLRTRSLRVNIYKRENIYEPYWTPQGTVDMKKIAEILVGNESLDIMIRYRVACIHCLEDDIYTLWGQLRDSVFYDNLNLIRRSEPAIVSFWSHYIEGEIAQLDSEMNIYCGSHNVTPYEYAFRYSAHSGNKAATQYFLQKLTPEEKERILVTTAGLVAERAYFKTHYSEHCCTDVLCFLLSAMDKDQQTDVFKSHPYQVLRCLLKWPWQRFFMETAKHVWTFRTKEAYNSLLLNIIDKAMRMCKDYNYQELFREFWQQSPTTHKKYVIEERETPEGKHVLTKLFWITDEKNIKLILKDATLTQKRNLIFCYKGKNTCKGLMYSDKWDLLQFFIQDCISSKNDMKIFKEEFNEHIAQSIVRFPRYKDKLHNFFQLLDDLIENSDKRKLTQDGHPAKMFCNVEGENVTHSMKK